MPAERRHRSGDMPLPLTRLIHESFSILMMYAYSQPALVRLLDAKFSKGEWKYLNKALFLYPIGHITRACLELGTLLRVLDDEEDISVSLRATKAWSLGRVVKDGAPDEPLYLRDLTNKLLPEPIKLPDDKRISLSEGLKAGR
jgi:hypothetical protein